MRLFDQKHANGLVYFLDFPNIFFRFTNFQLTTLRALYYFISGCKDLCRMSTMSRLFSATSEYIWRPGSPDVNN